MYLHLWSPTATRPESSIRLAREPIFASERSGAIAVLVAGAQQRALRVRSCETKLNWPLRIGIVYTGSLRVTGPDQIEKACGDREAVVVSAARELRPFAYGYPVTFRRRPSMSTSGIAASDTAVYMAKAFK